MKLTPGNGGLPSVISSLLDRTAILTPGSQGGLSSFDFSQHFNDAGYVKPGGWLDLTANFSPPQGTSDYEVFGPDTGYAGASFGTAVPLTLTLVAGGATACLAGYAASDLWQAVLDGTVIATWTGAQETANNIWQLNASGINLPAGSHIFQIKAHLTQPVNPSNFQALLLDKSVTIGAVRIHS